MMWGRGYWGVVLAVLSGVVAAAGPARVTTTLAVPGETVWIDLMPVVGSDWPRAQYLQVSFTLSNRSGHSIPLALVSHCGETNDAQFILYDALGNVVWRLINTDLGCPDTLEARALEDGARLRERVAIPLVNDGVPLPAGDYRLEAYVDGTPLYGAYAMLTVGHAY